MHNWIKNFGRNAHNIYFHILSIYLCKKENKGLICLHTQHKQSHAAIVMLEFSGAEQGDAAPDLSPVHFSLYLPGSSLMFPPKCHQSSRKKKIFFLFFFTFTPSSNTHSYKHTQILPLRIWARQFAVAHSSSPTSSTPTHQHPNLFQSITEYAPVSTAIW